MEDGWLTSSRTKPNTIHIIFVKHKLEEYINQKIMCLKLRGMFSSSSLSHTANFKLSRLPYPAEIFFLKSDIFY